VLGTGGTFDVSFDQPGTYRIFCALHPEMQATVVIN
jgi:plastocyanin